MIQALVFDLDDTLLGPGKEIHPEDQAALQYAQASSIRLVYATSRPLRAVRRFLPAELLEGALVVSLNGAIASRDDRLLESFPLGASTPAVLALLQARSGITLTLETDGLRFATNHPADAHWLDQVQQATADQLLSLESLDPASAVKISLDGQGKSLLDLVVSIEGLGLRAIPCMGGTFLNVVHPDVDKASTLARLLSSESISASEVVAFGDDIPDLGMLAWAGTAIAVGNAVPEVKAAVDLVIGDAGTGTIGRWIRGHLPERMLLPD